MELSLGVWRLPETSRIPCGLQFSVLLRRVLFSQIANIQHIDIYPHLLVFLHFRKAVPKPSLDHVLKCLKHVLRNLQCFEP